MITKDIKNLDFDFQLKSIDESDDNFFTFEGMASTFDVDLDGDVIQRGAFLQSIAKRMPVILYQHNIDEPIGVTEQINETSDGLFIKAKLPKSDTLVSGRIIPQMQVGSLNKMSIGFTASMDDMEMSNGVRTIKKVDLHEVSIVTFPANPNASIQGFKCKSDRLKSVQTKKEFEHILRESGFSKSAATMIASACDVTKFSCRDDGDDYSDVVNHIDDLLLSMSLDDAINLN